MKSAHRFVALVLLVVCSLVAPRQLAADTVTASFHISGLVPVVFSLTARGYPGDLDLNQGTQVADRPIGIMHFRYNNTIASLTFASDTLSGYPENGAGVAYAFPAGHEMMFKSVGCVTIDQAVLNGLTPLTPGGIEVLDVAAPLMGEFDCILTASWWGAATIQRGGRYSLTINVTMVSI